MRRLSIRQSLLGFGLVLVLVLGTVIGARTYHRAQEIVSEAQRGVIADTINRIDINLNTKVRYVNKSIQDSVNMVLALQAGLPQGIDPDTARRLGEDFREGMASVGVAVDTAILSGETVIYTTADRCEVNPQAVAEMYANVERAPQNNFWTDRCPGFLGGEEVIRVYHGIQSGTGPALLVAEFLPATFNNLLLANQNISRYQYIFILDRSGTVICSNRGLEEGLRGEIVRNFSSGLQKFFFQWEGEAYYACGQYNGLTGWVTFSAIAVEDLFPEGHTLRNDIFLVVAVAMTLMLLFILVLYRSITRPLKGLADAMKTAEGGNFAVRLPPGQEDEIGYLSHTFNDMVDRIDQLVNEVYQKELAQKSAEMEALQAQINPHFLYNTLDAINWMLIERDDMDISDIVVALGSLMQYTMDTSSATVPLHLECTYVQDYLRIQKCRLTHRLHYSVCLEEGLRQLEVPKLILQPLVENAIRHGVEPLAEGGRVEILCRREGDRAVITVRDNGRGMDQDQVARLQEGGQAPAGATSIGVRNVRRRLQLYFGQRCTFTIRSVPDQGTDITIAVAMDAGGGEHGHTDH